MNKQKQKQLITDIMNEDAKDRLYKQQTAVEWLFGETLGLTLQLENKRISHRNWELQMVKLFEQAKEMEKQQIIKAFDEGQEYEYQYHINSAPKFYSETYYQETYKKD